MITVHHSESPFESTTAEGVAVPAAPIPVFPVAPNGERPDQQVNKFEREDLGFMRTLSFG